MDEDGEDDEGDLLVLFDLVWEASIAGDARRRARQPWLGFGFEGRSREREGAGEMQE